MLAVHYPFISLIFFFISLYESLGVRSNDLQIAEISVHSTIDKSKEELDIKPGCFQFHIMTFVLPVHVLDDHLVTFARIYDVVVQLLTLLPSTSQTLPHSWVPCLRQLLVVPSLQSRQLRIQAVFFSTDRSKMCSAAGSKAIRNSF